MSNISDKIKIIRKVSGLTQREFGEKIKKEMQTIQRWEYGTREPDKTSLLLISIIFNVPYEWLTDDNIESLENPPDGNSDFIAQSLKTMQYFNKLSPEKRDKAFKYIQNLQRLDLLEEEERNKKIG